MSRPGLFVSVEGGEGVGKSTLLQNLIEHFKAWDADVVTTREPGGTPVANAIRGVFAGVGGAESILPMTELMLVNAARHQHVEHLLRPSILAGNIVISDRYADSSRVYQGELGMVPRDTVEQMLAAATGGLEPDITFFLDCELDIALARVQERENQPGTDGVRRYDDADVAVHRVIQRGFQKLAVEFPKRIVTLDAAKSPEEVLRDATCHLETWKARFS